MEFQLRIERMIDQSTEETICQLTYDCFVKLLQLQRAPCGFLTPDFLENIKVRLSQIGGFFLISINARNFTQHDLNTHAEFLSGMENWHCRNNEIFQAIHLGPDFIISFFMTFEGWAAMAYKINEMDGSFFSRLQV